MTEIISPLSVPISANKKFILNLNNYRNTHYQVLNKAKAKYKELIIPQLKALSKFEQISVHYRLFPKTKRRTDIGNVVSIHKKFFEDALSESGVIPDDDYKHVISSSEDFGSVDKTNGRVEIYIKEINTEQNPPTIRS